MKPALCTAGHSCKRRLTCNIASINADQRKFLAPRALTWSQLINVGCKGKVRSPHGRLIRQSRQELLCCCIWLPSGIRRDKADQRLFHLALPAAVPLQDMCVIKKMHQARNGQLQILSDYLRCLEGRPVFRVAMPLQLKHGQRADISEALDVLCKLTDEVHDGRCTSWKREIQNERCQNDASHLFEEQQGLHCKGKAFRWEMCPHLWAETQV